MDLNLTEQIKVLMGRANLGYTDLGHRMGMTPQAVSQMIKKGNPTLSSLRKLCEALECDLEIKLKERDRA